MKPTWNQISQKLVFCGSLFLFAGVAASGQAQGGGHPPPGGPPGSHGPGGPPGPGGPGGPGGSAANGAAPANSSSGSHGSVITSSGIKLGPVGRWWNDKAVVSAIGLRRDQQKKIDTIFNANKPVVIATYQAFEKEQAKLNAVSAGPNVDKNKVFAAIDSVGQARAALQKANTDMLLQIRQQLDPEQLVKLDKLP